MRNTQTFNNINMVRTWQELNGEDAVPNDFANAIKHDFRSKNPTTRWADVIKLH